MNIEEITVNDFEILTPTDMQTTDAPATSSQLKTELEKIVRVKVTSVRVKGNSVSFNTNDAITDGGFAFLLTVASSFSVKRSGKGICVTYTKK